MREPAAERCRRTLVRRFNRGSSAREIRMFRWIMLFLGLTVMTSPRADEWQRRSPEGAVSNDVARASARVLLGTSDGLYASGDDGSSWTRIESVPPSQSVHKITVDPHDANHWYVLVRETYLDSSNTAYPIQTRYVERETRDGGLSWQSPTFHMRPNHSRGPVFHPAANRVIAQWSTPASASGWQYSADGGLSWTARSGSYWIAVGLSLPGHPFGALSVSDEDFTTMSFRLGSADGSSFAPIATLNIPGAYSFHTLMPRAAASQAFWIAARNLGSTYVGSVDFGNGQLVQFPSYDGKARQVFDDPAAPGTVLLSTAQESADYAQRFGLSALTPGASQWSPRGGVAQSFKGAPQIEPEPTTLVDGSRIWLTDAGVGVHRSVDGGATWQVSNSGLRAAAVNAVSLDPRDPDRLLAGRDMQSLQRSVDAGLHWSNVGGSAPHDVRALARSPVDPDHLLATARGGLYRSRDAGETWQAVPTAVDPAPNAPGWREIVWCANTDTHLLATVDRNLYRSLDGGLSWGFVRADAYALEGASRAPLNVYVTGSVGNERVARTNDCGASFVTIATDNISSLTVAVSPYDSRIVAMPRYAPWTTVDPRVALSNDGGSSWTLTAVPGWERAGPRTALGWFHGCATSVFTTAGFLTGKGATLASLLPELPRRTNQFAQMRAADSHCIDGESVAVIGLHDGVWLHRVESRIFADGFETP